MRIIDNTIILSASDLSSHASCKHKTYLDHSVVKGDIAEPEYYDPALAILQERGREFESEYLDYLRSSGLSIAQPNSVDETLSLMKEGADIVYQGTFQNSKWFGRTDFLIKVDKPSLLGAWSYEVADTKLAKETRSATVLQLCLYSELLTEVQGYSPEYAHVITPEEGFTRHSFRLDDFWAYYRLLKSSLVKVTDVQAEVIPTYPEPCAHCEICRWWKTCDQKRRSDDHLSLVAGLSNSNAKEIQKWDISKVEAFSKIALPLKYKPTRGAKQTYEKLREQARVQVDSREKGSAQFEVLPIQAGQGLSNLPLPSEGDIFFDFEGDPYIGSAGLEYLFGWVTINDTLQYHSIWALNPEQEKKAFEDFVDFVINRLKVYPDLHIYHYTAYEPSALKRLMGRYGTREDEIDTLLRSNVFIDLYSVVRNAVRAGVEKYSLKELEIFHGYQRKVPLRDASAHLRSFQGLLERRKVDLIPSELMMVIQAYNEDDCMSTFGLRQWLEAIRDEIIAKGGVIDRPESVSGVANEAITEHQERIAPLFNSLMLDVPIDELARTPEQHARWLLAHMLDWYRREKKALWWEFYRLKALTAMEHLDEKSSIGMLTYTGKREPESRSFVDYYSFPIQDYDIREGDELKSDNGDSLGTLFSIDKINQVVAIKKSGRALDIHPTAIFKHTDVRDTEKESSILRLAEWVVKNGMDSKGGYQAGRDLLMNNLPRTTGTIPDLKDAQARAIAWVGLLDNGVLPIQGPPGSGKSHTAAEMMLTLIESGKKIGITALSHKVIIGLMEKTLKISRERGIELSCIHKVSKKSLDTHPSIQEITDNGKVVQAMRNANIIGGTPWLWAREELKDSVDYLFVDEAGQLSLIDTVAVSQATNNLVLLGDPQQLKQPQQGSHPVGTEVSALEHILKQDQTIPKEKGIFLDITWRLHPEICTFVSELFYESKLDSKSGLENQSILGGEIVSGSGLRFVPILHEGNQSSSIEEVEAVSRIISGLLNHSAVYVNSKGEQKVISADDIKVITPYNAQVNLLTEALGNGIQIGTVDKFQGQEAPVIIYSMATSSPEDAPRGMEFLYSPNRLNVAASRARAIFILVANPALFEPDCKSISQMKLANAFCRFRELSKELII